MNNIDLQDLKDPSKLNNTVKFLCLTVIFLCGLLAIYFLDTQPQITQLESLSQQEQELRNTYLDKKRQAVNLDTHRQQLSDIQKSFSTLLRQLPNKSEMDALLADVNQSGVGQGLSFDLFRPATSEISTEFYSEQPVSITVTGVFHQIGSFSESLAKLSRIVNLTDINIRVNQNPQTNKNSTATPGTSLIMDATVKTYRYLDEKAVSPSQAASQPNP